MRSLGDGRGAQQGGAILKMRNVRVFRLTMDAEFGTISS